MATDNELVRGTVNEALYRDGDALARVQLWSAGLQPNVDPTAAARTGADTYNGGICYKRVSRIEKGDLLFRFSSSSVMTLEEKCRGCWWFDKECFDTMRRASRLDNATFAATARTFLGVLVEWGDMGNLVGGIATADFWCYKGLTGAFVGNTQKFSGPPRTDIVQIYVPGALRLANLTQVHDNVLTSGIT